MKSTINSIRSARIASLSRQTAAVIAMLLALGMTAAVGSATLLLSPASASAAVVSGGDATTAARGGGGAAGGDITSAASNAETMVRTLGASAVAIALVFVCVAAAYTKKYTLAVGSLGFCMLAALMITDAGYNLVVNTAGRLAG
jgi:hypothetical protein